MRSGRSGRARDGGYERSAGKEYEAVNAHLRANIGQFVNWFSFFLTFSFAALAVFVATETAGRNRGCSAWATRCPRPSFSCTCWPSAPS
jgi:hypothetical protein